MTKMDKPAQDLFDATTNVLESLTAQYRANAVFYREYAKRYPEGSQGWLGNIAEAEKYEGYAEAFAPRKR